MYIVGIDIAKRKHEAAVIDGDGAVIIKPFSFTNNCSGYNRLLAMMPTPMSSSAVCVSSPAMPRARMFWRQITGAAA